MVKPNLNMLIQGPVKGTENYKTVILKPGVDFASQVGNPNTRYIIKWNYDLGGSSVAILANCILQFEGGSISNGTLALSKTILHSLEEKDKVLINVTLEGDYQWFLDTARNKDYIPAKYSGLGRVYLQQHFVDAYPDNLWLYVPVNGVVYLLYTYDMKLWAVAQNDTEGLGLEANLVVKPANYNLSDISDLVGSRRLSFTEDGGVWTITKPNGTTITSTEINNSQIFNINDVSLMQSVNVLTQNMIDKPHTIYHIQHDFVLGEDITIPANCVLEFDGGSISGGTIIGNATILNGVGFIGSNMSFSGTFASFLDILWVKDRFNNVDYAFELSNAFGGIRLGREIYNVQDTINITAEEYTLEGIQALSLDSYLYFPNEGRISDKKMFNITNTVRKLNVRNVYLRGHDWPNPYSSAKYGIAIHNERNLRMKFDNVRIVHFHIGLHIQQLIDSVFNKCYIGSNDDGIIVFKTNDVLTTTRFTNSYIQANYRNVTLEANSILDISFISTIFESACYYNLLDKGQNQHIIIDNCYTEANSIGYTYNGSWASDTENIRKTVFESIAENTSYQYQHTCVMSITNCTINGSNDGGNLTKCVKLDAGVLNMQNNKFSRFNSIITLTNNYSVSGTNPKYTIIFNGSYMYSTPPALFEDDTLLKSTDIVDITYITNSGVDRREIASSLKVLDTADFVNSIVNGVVPAFGYQGVAKRVLAVKNNSECVVAIDKHLTIFGKQANHNTGSPYGRIGDYNGIGLVNETGNNINDICEFFKLYGGNEKTTAAFIISCDTTNDSGVFAIHKDSDGTTDSVVVERLSAPYKKGSDNRPKLRNVYYDKGFCFFDTTLGKPIYWNGTAWVDATGTTV